MAKTRNHVRVGTKLINTDDDNLILVGPVADLTSALAQVIVCAETTDTYQGPDIDVRDGIFLRYGSTNSGYGYFGGSTAVATTDRYELAPGDQIYIPLSNVSELYVVGSTTDSTFYWAQA